MAHLRDRIPIRNPKEGVRGLAFRMVLHGGCPTVGSCSDRPPQIQQCSLKETPKLASAELSERRRQGRPSPDGSDKTIGSFRTNHD